MRKSAEKRKEYNKKAWPKYINRIGKEERSKRQIVSYIKNRDKVQARHKIRRVEICEFVDEQKKGKQCAYCGNVDWRVLEFHHLGDKDMWVSIMRTYAWGRDKILAEIAKCVILCTNCHKILHHEERQTEQVASGWKCSRARRAAAYKLVDDYKKKSKCIKCGNNDWRVLEFNHRDPATKSGDIGRMRSDGCTKKLVIEMAQCDMYCGNCHKLYHLGECGDAEKD